MEQVEQDIDQRSQAFITGCAYGALFLAGLVFGVVESFTHTLGIGPVPVAAILACLINFAGILLAGRGMGSKLGATVPAIAWWLTLFLFTMGRAEGDVIIGSSVAGYGYMLGGTLAALSAIMLTPPDRSWLIARGVAPIR